MLQVDDSLSYGDSDFMRDEEKASSRFKSKLRTALSETPSNFNSIKIRKISGTTKSSVFKPNQTNDNDCIHDRATHTDATRTMIKSDDLPHATNNDPVHMDNRRRNTAPKLGKVDGPTMMVIRKAVIYRITPAGIK